MNKNKQLQFSRMRGFFLEAVNAIIEEGGIEKVSARKVADRAGYNVSTLYNYFDNVDHLIAMSLNDHIGGFVDRVINTVQKKATPKEIYQSFWFEFVEEAYSKPVIYFYLFFKNQDKDISEVFESYFKDNPDDFNALDEKFQKTLLEKNIYNRDLLFLLEVFPKKNKDKLSTISEMNVLMYKSLIQDLQFETSETAKNTSIERYKKYYTHLVKGL